MNVEAGEKQTYKMMGRIPEKDKDMLEERIKRVSKSRPPPGGPVAAAPAPAQEPSQPPSPAATGLPRPGSNRNLTSGIRMRYGHPSSAPGSAASAAAPAAMSASPNPSQPESRLPQSRGMSAGGRNRPVSGIFTLDFDKIESGSMHGSIGGPQLVNHNLDDIFDDEPVKLPSKLAYRRQGKVQFM